MRPLKVVEEATKKVASEEFVPVPIQPHRHDEISRLIGAFNKMVQELKKREDQLLQSRKMASIGTFTSGIAHELNNPINNISLIVESLEEEGNDLSAEERALLLQDLVGQAERTSDIVKKLLEFSRNRYAKTEIVALESIVQKTADLVQNEMRLNHVKFSQSIIGGPLPGLRVDKGGIQQVFLNLFLNSIQAMDGGGRIEVVMATDTTAREIRIDVRDTGKGVAPEHLDRLFDPFFSTKKEGEGTGLDCRFHTILSTSTTVESKSRASLERAPVFQSSCRWKKMSTKHDKKDRPRVAVVEDEAITGREIQRHLSKEAYRVDLFPDGESFVKKNWVKPFDVVLCDLRLPAMSGIDVLNTVKKTAPECEVIIMTGYGSVDTAIAAIQKGAFHYITKPFKTAELKSLVARAP